MQKGSSNRTHVCANFLTFFKLHPTNPIGKLCHALHPSRCAYFARCSTVNALCIACVLIALAVNVKDEDEPFLDEVMAKSKK